MLGFYVWKECNKLQWHCEGKLPMLPNVITCQSIFSVCGGLMRHFPVCGWLRVATMFIK